MNDAHRSELIAWDAGAFALGVAEMDATHRDFVERVNRLDTAPATEFRALFQLLLEHTRAHFESEEERMQVSGFPALSEHRAEHQRVLGELTQMQRQLDKGRSSFARSYVREGLPTWFRLHLATMDSALAAHWKTYRETSGL